MTREGYKVPRPDTPELRRKEQAALAAALKSLAARQ